MNIDWNKATERALARVRYTPELRELSDWEQDMEIDIWAIYHALAVEGPLREHGAELLTRLSRIENAAYMIGRAQGQKEALPW
jgi:hypothetical protein